MSMPIEPSNTPNRTLSEIVQQADAALLEEQHPELSEAAFRLLKEKVSQYIANILLESSRRAKRHKADVISASDIEKADEYLISSSSQKLIKNIGTLGGIVLGLGLSNGLAIISTNQFTPLGLGITILSCCIGAALVAYQFTKD